MSCMQQQQKTNRHALGAARTQPTFSVAALTALMALTTLTAWLPCLAMGTLLAMSLPTPAQAGHFSVSPVRIYMGARERATAVTLTNEGDTELVMQADIYQWRQHSDGQDELVLSEDMILSSPIVKLAPRSRQVVRLALLRPRPQGKEETFRLIVRELPEALPSDDSVKLRIAMAFSMPVFVSPPGAKRELQCVVERDPGAGARAVCENQGTAYAQPVDFVLQGASGQALASSPNGGYVLPGIRRAFDLAVPAGQRLPAGSAQLVVKQDNGQVQRFAVTLGD